MTDQEINIQAIEALGCTQEKRACPGANANIAQFRLGGRGDPDHGYLAIMGVGLAPNGVGNPLAAIGDGAWIITLPKPGARAPGTLILKSDGG